MREKNVENTNKSVQMTVYVESRYALDGGASGSWIAVVPLYELCFRLILYTFPYKRHLKEEICMESFGSI